MTIRAQIQRIVAQEDLNFLLTNRIPRAALTRFMGWFSRIENPLVRDLSIACWRLFSDLDLSEARKTEFKSLHDCFTRELRPGLRPADPDPERASPTISRPTINRPAIARATFHPRLRHDLNSRVY